MAITRVTDGNPAAATDLNQLIDLMEGAETIDYLLKSLVATDFKVRLADSAGARKLIIQDSAGVTVAYIDSDGNASFTSTALGTLILPAHASTNPTTDAQIIWDIDDNYTKIGDGTGTKIFQPDNQGSDIAAAATLNITDKYHRITGATGITAISTKPAGFIVGLTFASTPAITHSASLRLAGAANYTVTAEETLYFQSDGTNWREIGRKPPATASGLVLAGRDTTERTTVSTTAVDLSTISSLNIPTDAPFDLWVPFRKTTGAAASVSLGLTLNATNIQTPFAVTASGNAAHSGLAIFHFGPREANYLKAVTADTTCSDGTSVHLSFSDTANMPTAAITSVIVRGLSGSGSVTLAVKNVAVYVYPTS